MNPKKNEYGSEYDLGPITSSESLEEKRMRSVEELRPTLDDIKVDQEKYTSGKPKRIIIRARITHD